MSRRRVFLERQERSNRPTGSSPAGLLNTGRLPITDARCPRPERTCGALHADVHPLFASCHPDRTRYRAPNHPLSCRDQSLQLRGPVLHHFAAGARGGLIRAVAGLDQQQALAPGEMSHERQGLPPGGRSMGLSMARGTYDSILKQPPSTSPPPSSNRCVRWARGRECPTIAIVRRAGQNFLEAPHRACPRAKRFGRQGPFAAARS